MFYSKYQQSGNILITTQNVISFLYINYAPKVRACVIYEEKEQLKTTTNGEKERARLEVLVGVGGIY